MEEGNVSSEEVALFREVFRPKRSKVFLRGFIEYEADDQGRVVLLDSRAVLSFDI